MADRYPTTPGSVQQRAAIAVPRAPEQAALREQQRQLLGVSQAADRVVQFALKQERQQAELAGEHAGATAPEQTLQQFSDRDPFTVYERSAYDAAVRVSSARISTDALMAMREAHFEAVRDNQPPEELASRLASITAGFGEALEAVSPAARAELENRLRGQTQSLFLDHSEKWMREEAKANQAFQVRLFDEYSEIALNWGRNPDGFSAQLDPDAEYQGPATPDAGLEAMLLDYEQQQLALGRSAGEAASDVIKLRTIAHIQRVRSEFANADDKADYLARFEQSLNEGGQLTRGLKGEKGQSLSREMVVEVNQLQSELRAGVAAVSAAQTDAAHAAKRAITAYGDGLLTLGSPSERALADLDRLMAASGNDPEAGVAYQQFLTEMGVLKGLRLQPNLIAMQAFAQDVLEHLPNDTPEQMELQQFVREALAHDLRLAKSDLIAYHNLARPDDPIPLLVDADLIDSAALESRLTRVAEVAQTLGVDAPKFFTAEERGRLRTVLHNPEMPPEQRLAVLGAIAKSSPVHGRAAVQEVTEGDGALFVAGSMFVDGRPMHALQILDGVAAHEAGRTVPVTPTMQHEAQRIFDATTDVVGTFPILDAESLAFAENIAELMVLGGFKRGTATKDMQETYTQALQVVMGATFDTDGQRGGIMESRNGKYNLWVDPKMTEGDLHALERLLDARDVVTQQMLQDARRHANRAGVPGFEDVDALPRYLNDEPHSKGKLQIRASDRPGVAILLDQHGNAFKDYYEVPLWHLLQVVKSRTVSVRGRPVALTGGE